MQQAIDNSPAPVPSLSANPNMRPASEVIESCRNPGLGYDRVVHIPGTTYQDNSTVVVVPTRGMVHQRFVSAFMNMIAPMNQKRAVFWATGHEVGKAYDACVQAVISNPDLAKWKYILTVEDDNLVPPDAHVRLLESIEAGKFDAVGGIYWTKGDVNMPMAYGDPAEYMRTGVLDFRPRDLRAALSSGASIVEVNGLAMGCTLWRMELFKKFAAPWFVTVADLIEGKGVACFTQDLYACERFKKGGARLGVDLRVRVGHLDIESGIVY